MDNKAQNERLASSIALSKMSDDYERDNKCLMCNTSFPYFEVLDSGNGKCSGDECMMCKNCCPSSIQCGCGVYYDTHEDEDKSKCWEECDQLPRACCGVVTKNLYEMCDECIEELEEEAENIKYVVLF